MRFSGSMCFFNPLSGFFIYFTLFIYFSISILFILMVKLNLKPATAL